MAWGYVTIFGWTIPLRQQNGCLRSFCPNDKANVPAKQTVPHACNGKCSWTSRSQVFTERGHVTCLNTKKALELEQKTVCSSLTPKFTHFANSSTFMMVLIRSDFIHEDACLISALNNSEMRSSHESEGLTGRFIIGKQFLSSSAWCYLVACVSVCMLACVCVCVPACVPCADRDVAAAAELQRTVQAD